MTAIAPTAKELIQSSIQANKDHQVALKSYTERLETELEALDNLLAATEVNDDEEPDLEVGGYVSIPGSTRASAPIALSDLLSEESPFFHDAERRQRYLDLTGYHSMKAKELEDLAEAVRTENYRLYALQAQSRGQFSFTDLENKSSEFLEQNRDQIDWERVASTISSKSQSHIQRTPKECEIRWLGDRHPEFNHAAWSPTETAQCRSLVAEYSSGPVDWMKISQDLGTHRTPLDCMRHGVVRKMHVWSPESDKKLLDAIQIYGTNNWLIVARVVSPDATAQQCQNRFQRSLDPSLKRGAWSSEEDAKLRLAVEAYGNSWLDVANTVEGRNNEQCRDRWNEKLDPKINRNAWDDDEDAQLLEAVAEIGEGKWKAVSERLGNGRKDSACRARYDILKKRKGKSKVVDLDDGSQEAARPRSRQTARKAKEPVENSVDDSGHAPARPRPKPRKKATEEEKPQEPQTEVHEEDANDLDSSSRSRDGVSAEMNTLVDEFGDIEGETGETHASGENPPVKKARPSPRKKGAPSKARQSPAGDLESEDDQENRKRKSHIEGGDAEENTSTHEAAPRKRGRPIKNKESKPRALPTRRQPSRASRK